MKSINKGNMGCIAVVIMALFFSIAERGISYFVPARASVALLQGLVLTLFLLVELIILYRSEDSYYTMIASLIAMKLIPPLSMLKVTYESAYMMYYIVTKVSVAFLVIIIIKSFRVQKESEKIGVLPLLAFVCLNPFLTEIGDTLSSYFISNAKSMMYVYAVKAFVSGMGILIIFLLAVRADGRESHFICLTEQILLSLNIFKNIAVIIAHMAMGEHISKSYFVLSAMYIVFLTMFILIDKKRKKAVTD